MFTIPKFFGSKRRWIARDKQELWTVRHPNGVWITFWWNPNDGGIV